MFDCKNTLTLVCVLSMTPALFSADVIAGRRQFRKEVFSDAETVRSGLHSPDSEIRRFALVMLYRNGGVKALPEAEKALEDSDARVRVMAAHICGKHLTENLRRKLQRLASSDPVPSVKYQAHHELWPFNRKNLLLKNDRSWDYLVKPLNSFPIPLAGICKTDPAQTGHSYGYQNPGVSVQDWMTFSAGQPFALAAGQCMWIRTEFVMPKPEKTHHALELVIPATGDWDVWLNGVYLGDSRANPEKGAFRLDCTAEAKPGESNLLVLRASGGKTAPAIAGEMRGEYME